MHSASTPLVDNQPAFMEDTIDEQDTLIKGGKPHHPVVTTGLSHTAKYVIVVPPQFIYICISDKKIPRASDCWESLHFDYTAGWPCGWVTELARSLQQTGLAIDHITALLNLFLPKTFYNL